MVSQKLRAAIKLGPVPAYKVAQEAGLDPSTLSKLLCGIVRVKSGDPRITAVAKVVGVPENECFDDGGPTDG